MPDASLGPLITGVLLVMFGPIAVKIVERLTGNAPTWVWRLLAFLCIAAGWAIVLLNDPVNIYARLHPRGFAALTILVLIIGGLVVRTRWFDATPSMDSAKRASVISQLQDYVKEARRIETLPMLTQMGERFAYRGT